MALARKESNLATGDYQQAKLSVKAGYINGKGLDVVTLVILTETLEFRLCRHQQAMRCLRTLLFVPDTHAL
jgi:hypothetical protein